MFKGSCRARQWRGFFISIFVLVLDRGAFIAIGGKMPPSLAHWKRAVTVEAGIPACQPTRLPVACSFRRSGNTKMRLL
jgi:hypothetical protein